MDGIRISAFFENDMKNNTVNLLKNHSGLSLMEVIVVVAIVSVLVGVTSLGFGLVSTKSATECAQKMDICLNRARVNTMGKQKGFIAFYSDSEGYVYAVEKYDNDYSGSIPASGACAALTTGEMSTKIGTKIGKKGITVTCGSTSLTGSAYNPVYFEFSRSDGSLKDTCASNAPIVVTKGSRTLTINIQKLTGKISITK